MNNLSTSEPPSVTLIVGPRISLSTTWVIERPSNAIQVPSQFYWQMIVKDLKCSLLFFTNSVSPFAAILNSEFPRESHRSILFCILCQSFEHSVPLKNCYSFQPLSIRLSIRVFCGRGCRASKRFANAAEPLSLSIWGCHFEWHSIVNTGEHCNSVTVREMYVV